MRQTVELFELFEFNMWTTEYIIRSMITVETYFDSSRILSVDKM